MWLSRRREVDEAVAQLTHYGPAASDRVHSHLSALRQLLLLEAEAFAAVERDAPEVPQLPLPTAAVGVDHTVVPIAAGRTRRSRQTT